ncbi:MAG: hypothetical protein AB7S26_40290 [Sandaracinaceae bacterium]
MRLATSITVLALQMCGSRMTDAGTMSGVDAETERRDGSSSAEPDASRARDAGPLDAGAADAGGVDGGGGDAGVVSCVGPGTPGYDRVDGRGLRITRDGTYGCFDRFRHVTLAEGTGTPAVSFPTPNPLMIDGVMIPAGTMVHVGNGVLTIDGALPTVVGDYGAAIASGARAIIAGVWTDEVTLATYWRRMGGGFEVTFQSFDRRTYVQVRVTWPFEVTIGFPNERATLDGLVGTYTQSGDVELPCEPCTDADRGGTMLRGSWMRVAPTTEPIGPRVALTCLQEPATLGYSDEDYTLLYELTNYGDQAIDAPVELGYLYDCAATGGVLSNLVEMVGSLTHLEPGESATGALSGPIFAGDMYGTVLVHGSPRAVVSLPPPAPNRFLVTSPPPPDGMVGVPYRHMLSVGPLQPWLPDPPAVTWRPWIYHPRVVIELEPAIPDWLTLHPSGLLEGTPPAPGQYVVLIKGEATDYRTARLELTIDVR